MKISPRSTTGNPNTQAFSGGDSDVSWFEVDFADADDACLSRPHSKMATVVDCSLRRSVVGGILEPTFWPFCKNFFVKKDAIFNIFNDTVFVYIPSARFHSPYGRATSSNKLLT